MTLCTFLLEHTHKIPLETIRDQDWSDFQLIYTSRDEGSAFGPQSSVVQQKALTFVPWNGEHTWEDMIEQSKGSFIAWIHPTEKWNTVFLKTLKDNLTKKLESNHYKNHIPSAFGFMYDSHSIQFSSDCVPELKSTNTLYRNMEHPVFYSPMIKYFFDTEIVRQYRIPNDLFHADWRERYAMYTLQYILAFQDAFGGAEPLFFEFPAGFSLSKSELFQDGNFQEYHSLIESKRSSLMKNPWNPVFWHFIRHDLLEKLSKAMHSIIPSKT